MNRKDPDRSNQKRVKTSPTTSTCSTYVGNNRQMLQEIRDNLIHLHKIQSDPATNKSDQQNMQIKTDFACTMANSLSSGSTSHGNKSNLYRQKALAEIRNSLLPFANETGLSSGASTVSTISSTTSGISSVSGLSNASGSSSPCQIVDQNGMDRNQQYDDEGIHGFKQGHIQCDASNLDVNFKLQMEAQQNGLPKHISGGLNSLASKVIRKSSFESGVCDMHRISPALEGSSTASTCSDSISLSSLPIRALFEPSRTANQLDPSKPHLQVSRQYSPNFPTEPPPLPPPRLQGPPPTPPRGVTPPSPPPSIQSDYRMVQSSFLPSNQMQHMLKRISPGPQTNRSAQGLPYGAQQTQNSTPQQGTSPLSIGRAPIVVQNSLQHQLNHQLQSALYTTGVAQMEPPPPYPIGSAQTTKMMSPPPYPTVGNNRQSPTSDYSSVASQIQKRVSPTVYPQFSLVNSTSQAVTTIANATSIKPAPLQAWNARQPPPIMLSVKSTQVQKPILQTAVAPAAPPMTNSERSIAPVANYATCVQQKDGGGNEMINNNATSSGNYMCAGVTAQYACSPPTVPTTEPPSYASTMQAMAVQRGVGNGLSNSNVNNNYSNYSLMSSSTTVANVMNNLANSFESQLRTSSASCVSVSYNCGETGTTMTSSGHTNHSSKKVSTHAGNHSPVSFTSSSASSTHSEMNNENGQQQNRRVNGQVGEMALKTQTMGWNVSPIPERKLYHKEKDVEDVDDDDLDDEDEEDDDDEGCETKVRNYSPQAFKFYMEQHVENVLKSHQQRMHRRHQLETEMAKVGLSEEAQFQMRKMLHQKESNYIRLKRAKMDKAMFVKIKSIGVGAFGEVALVRKLDTQHLYAMKTLKKTDVLKRNQVAHVKAERDILAEADNEWVVKLYYSFQDQDNLYFVMDYIPGGDLMSLLIKLGIFEEPLARFYIAELVCAVESVHKMGFIHRDIKPDNILIDRDGHIKLTDFGLCTGFRWTHNSKYYQNAGDHSRQDSMEPDENWKNDCQCNNKSTFREKPLERRWRREHQRCLAHSLVGTPNYIAPEVLIREGYTQMCDWWSVGVILYEMLVGQPPFLAKTQLETQVKVINWKNSLKIPRSANLSPEAEDLILKLCTDWEKRLGKSASEVKAHKFFASVDFKEGLRRQPAPLTPVIRSPTDTSNFDPVDPDKLHSDSGCSDANGNFGYDNGKHPEHAFFEFTFRRFFDGGGHAYPTKLGVGMVNDGDNQEPVYV